MQLKDCVQRNVSNFDFYLLVCLLTGVYLARKEVVIKRLHVYIPKPIYFTYRTRSTCLYSISVPTHAHTPAVFKRFFLLKRYCGP